MSVTSGMHGGASEMRRRVRMAGELHVPSAESGRVKVERETEDGEHVVRVTFGHRSCICLFLMLWLSGWSYGCYKLLVDLFTKPFDFKVAIIALPFLAAEIGVTMLVLMMLFGRTVFTFRREGGTKFSGIGRFGVSKAFTFPVKGEIDTDEIVRSGGKGGPRTYYRLVVKTQFDLDGPRVIYESQDADIVYCLCKAAQEVAGTIVPPEEKKSPDDLAAEASEAERRDFELLAGKPPKGVSVARDFEGRVVVVVRRVRWALALVFALVMSGFTAVVWCKSPELPIPLMAFFGVCMLFPFVQLVFALFGRRTMTLDRGKGETFVGVGSVGPRRQFEYAGHFDIRLEESGMWVNNERMTEIVVVKPGGTPRKICTSWPNDVKPYLAALLRHPASAPATIDMMA